jgi:hypothetical protein
VNCNRAARCLAGVVFVIVAGVMSRAGWAASSYNSVTVTHFNIFQASSGAAPGVVIFFTPAISDSEGCTKSGQGYAYIDWTSTLQPDGKALYATALAAALAGKRMDIVVGGCSQGNYYPLVYQIVVYP